MALFDSWLELHNNSITCALTHINKKLDTSYQHGRFNQWRKGTHLPSAEALHLIHNETLHYVLNKFEEDETIQSLILDHMSLPNNKKS